MLHIKAKPSKGESINLSGIVDLSSTGTIQLSEGSDSVAISCPTQQAYTDWYSGFCADKLRSMTKTPDDTTASYVEDNHLDVNVDRPVYEFIQGFQVYRKDGYLTTIQHVAAKDLNFWVLPDKTIDVYEGEQNQLVLSVSVHHKQPDKRYVEMDIFLWRLYHCINSLIGRLQIYAPTFTRDGHPAISDMGPYLGTFIQYQALVTRWNAYAWATSFLFEVKATGERATIAFGYTNLNCEEYGPVSMDLEVHYLGLKDITGTLSEEDLAEYKTAPMTLYNQGIDSTIDEGKIKVRTVYRRSESNSSAGTVINGTGFEGKEPERMRQGSITVDLLRKDEDALPKPPLMTAEQHYRTIAALAPCAGTTKSILVQKGEPTVFHMYEVLCTWTIGTQNFTKTCSVDLAVSVVK